MVLKKIVQAAAGTPLRSATTFSIWLLALLLYFYWTLLGSGAQYYLQDHTYYFEPLTKYTAERLRHGQVPLWNPNMFCGMSQIACINPNFVYPPNIAFLYMAYSKALAAIMLFHQFVAALGCFLLAISFGWGVTAAAVFGTIGGCSGYMFSLSANYTLVTSAAWLPLTLWFFWKLKESLETQKQLRFIYFIGASVSTFMLVCAGRPEVFAPACAAVISLCLGVFLKTRGKREHSFKILLWQAAAFACGIMLTMPVMLPVMEWLNLSPRKAGMELQYSLLWSSNWYDFFMFAFSRPLGDMQLLGNKFIGIAASRPYCLPLIPTTFVGPIALTLALAGFTNRSWTWRWWVLAGTAAAAIACLGKFTPIMPFLETYIKSLTVFRYPAKWMIFLIFCVGTAAARGAFVLVRGQITKLTMILPAALWTAVLAVAQYYKIANPAFSKDPDAIETWHQINGLCSNDAAIASLLGLTACLVCWLIYRKTIKPLPAALLVVLSLTISLFASAFDTAPSVTYAEYFRRAPYLSALLKNNGAKPQDRYLPLYRDPTTCPSWYKPVDELNWTQTYFNYQRDLLIPMTGSDGQIKETCGYEAAPTGNFEKLLWFVKAKSRASHPTQKVPKESIKDSTDNRMTHPLLDADIKKATTASAVKERATDLSDEDREVEEGDDLSLFRFLQATSTRFVGTQITQSDNIIPILDERFFKLKVEDRSMNLRVYETKNILPRAYLSQYWEWKDSQSKTMTAIANTEHSGFNPSLISWVFRNPTSGENDTKGTTRSFGALIPLPPGNSPLITESVRKSSKDDIDARDPLIAEAPVTVLVDQPEHVSVSFRSDRPAMLVLTDHYYPGWQAVVDGARRKIFKTNSDMRSVYVPAGSHLVEFNYEPTSWKFGWIGAAAGIAMLVGALLTYIAPYFWHLMKKLAGQV